MSNNQSKPPTTFKVQGILSSPDSAEVDERVTEAIRSDGPQALPTILHHMGSPGIDCNHDNTMRSPKMTVYSFTIASPLHGGEFIGIVDGCITSVRSKVVVQSPELKQVTPKSDSSISVTIRNGKLTWGDAPLYWMSDSTEFHVAGNGFETLCRYLNGFGSDFDLAKLHYIASHIGGIERGGSIPPQIEGGGPPKKSGEV